MSLTTIIGALVALLPPALLHTTKSKSNLSREPKHELEVENARLKREIAVLDRALATQTSLKVHWRDEAKRRAWEARQERELRRNPLPVPTWAEMQGRMQAQAQLQALAQHANQSQQAQQNAQLAQQTYNGVPPGTQTHQSAYQGLCNCVPSRAQVWAYSAGSFRR